MITIPLIWQIIITIVKFLLMSKLSEICTFFSANRLKTIGVWRWNRDGEATSYLTSPLTPDLTQVYADFRGRQLKGAVVPNWPFFKVTPLETRDEPYQEAEPHSGIDFNVLNSIATKLNFTLVEHVYFCSLWVMGISHSISIWFRYYVRVWMCFFVFFYQRNDSRCLLVPLWFKQEYWSN